MVVRAINMESQLLNYLGSITADIKDLSSSLFSFLVKGIPIWARRCRSMLAVAHGSEQVLMRSILLIFLQLYALILSFLLHKSLSLILKEKKDADTEEAIIEKLELTTREGSYHRETGIDHQGRKLS